MPPWIRWLSVGIFATALAAFVTIAASAGGHGSYVPAAVLFPPAMAVAVMLSNAGPISVAVALAQYPIYGLLLARLKGSPRALLALAGAHGAAAIVACLLVLRSETFS